MRWLNINDNFDLYCQFVCCQKDPERFLIQDITCKMGFMAKKLFFLTPLQYICEFYLRCKLRKFFTNNKIPLKRFEQFRSTQSNIFKHFQMSKHDLAKNGARKKIRIPTYILQMVYGKKYIALLRAFILLKYPEILFFISFCKEAAIG